MQVFIEVRTRYLIDMLDRLYVVPKSLFDDAVDKLSELLYLLRQLGFKVKTEHRIDYGSTRFETESGVTVMKDREIVFMAWNRCITWFLHTGGPVVYSVDTVSVPMLREVILQSSLREWLSIVKRELENLMKHRLFRRPPREVVELCERALEVVRELDVTLSNVSLKGIPTKITTSPFNLATAYDEVKKVEIESAEIKHKLCINWYCEEIPEDVAMKCRVRRVTYVYKDGRLLVEFYREIADESVLSQLVRHAVELLRAKRKSEVS